MNQNNATPLAPPRKDAASVRGQFGARMRDIEITAQLKKRQPEIRCHDHRERGNAGRSADVVQPGSIRAAGRLSADGVLVAADDGIFSARRRARGRFRRVDDGAARVARFEYESYLWSGYGMYTQLWAMHLIGIWLGCIQRLLRTGRGYFGAVAASATLVVSHPFYA
jgi:hypothetical protein